MSRAIWTHNDNDLVEAIEQVRLRVQTGDVHSIYLSKDSPGNLLDADKLDKEQLVETLARWSLAYTMWYVGVDLAYRGYIHFALTESKDGSTNITWEVIEQIVDVIDIWKEQRKKRGNRVKWCNSERI